MPNDQQGSVRSQFHPGNLKPLCRRKKRVQSRTLGESLTRMESRWKMRSAMKFRTYKNTDLTVSEVGFGLWTVSTGWWGDFTEGEAIALMHKAFDLGVTLF